MSNDLSENEFKLFIERYYKGWTGDGLNYKLLLQPIPLPHIAGERLRSVFYAYDEENKVGRFLETDIREMCVWEE